MTTSRWLIGGVVAVLALALAPGCGGDDPPEAAPTQTATILERDFKISAPDRLQAGTVRLAVDNKGPVAHELIVVRDRPGRLPVRDDGITIDEDGLGDDVVGALEPEQPGTRELDVDLEPGRYVMFCNMSGHYRSGMRAAVVVQ